MKSSITIHTDTATTWSPTHNTDVTDVTIWIHDDNSPTGRTMLALQTIWGGTDHDDIINNVQADIVSAISRNLAVTVPA